MVGIKNFEMPVNCGDCYLTSIKSVSNPWDMICSCNLKDIDINERTRAEHCPLAETISKADYENRLKADMVAMLTDIQLEIEEIIKEAKLIDKEWANILHYSEKIIQQKIDAMKMN